MKLKTSKIIDLENTIYQHVCEEWIEAISTLKEQEAQVAKLREKLLELSNGDRMEYGVKIAMVTSKGKTNYRAIVEELGVSDAVIERHTGMPETSYRVTKY